MEYLSIKKDIDLKDLEKYGFEKLFDWGKTYYVYETKMGCIVKVNSDRELYVYPETKYADCTKALVLIYKMIQDNIVELKEWEENV